ncbi:deoxynucleotidyltransferase terminal-interacting protein 2 [Diorhabda sublineata]|uniref:deoxynucleotidyltransferase terminal-interacting protein 2 n=1 Tax=Diorhabda sublineata TaxID=1163346 RepID=UPI0024E15F4B|nr:deoxynucleotidyltransferase terminal-interacting protein 2 [Diorhabda sublineata]
MELNEDFIKTNGESILGFLNDDEEDQEKLDFVIDTTGNSFGFEENDSDDSTSGEISSQKLYNNLFSDCKIALKSEKSTNKPEKVINPVVKEVLADLGFNDNGTLKKKPIKTKNVITDKQDIKKVLEKSILNPEVEKNNLVPPLTVSDKLLRKQRKKERQLTKGAKWYGLPATELTDEVKRDLEILQMRSVLDPKHFYKKNDLKVLPKYFQIGTVMDSPLDYYNNRLPKKERKKTLVDELMADMEFNKYNKRKYKEIIEEKKHTNYKAWRQAKRFKNKK